MTRMRRRVAVGAVGMIAAVLVAAGVAWACTGMPALTVPMNEVAPTGQMVANVSLTPGQVPNGTPVDIRWNTLDGPTLATVTAGVSDKATVSLKVPDVAPGVYYLVLTPGGNGRLASEAIEVTSPGTPQAAPSVWSERNRRRESGRHTSSPSGLPFVAGTVLLLVGAAALSTAGVVGLRRSRVPVSGPAGSRSSIG